MPLTSTKLQWHGTVFELEPEIGHHTERVFRCVAEHVQLTLYDRPAVRAITAVHSDTVHVSQLLLPVLPLGEEFTIGDDVIPVPSSQPDLLYDALSSDDERSQHAQRVEHCRGAAQYCALCVPALLANILLPSENDKHTNNGATLGSLAQPWILFEDP